jgi:hypothetical protein
MRGTNPKAHQTDNNASGDTTMHKELMVLAGSALIMMIHDAFGTKGIVRKTGTDQGLSQSTVKNSDQRIVNR